MSGSQAPAMETGCWCELDGMYFSFLRADQVQSWQVFGIRGTQHKDAPRKDFWRSAKSCWR
jgi:hypothetical protein